MKKTQWTFVGTGMIANAIAPLIQGSEKNRIVNVYGRSYEKAEKLAESIGAHACRTLEEALRDSETEIVYIAVTADAHFDVAKTCIEMGKPVMLEKPFCVSRKKAEELFALAKEKGVYLADGLWSWYNPVNLKTKEWVASKKIGRILSAKLTYCAPVLDAFPRLRDPARAGGALMDNGIYPVSFCYQLFGLPENLICKGNMDGGLDMEEHITFEYDDFKAECEVSLLKETDSVLTIVGELGTITTNMYHAAAETEIKFKDGSTENYKDYGMFDVEFTKVGEELQKGLLTGETISKDATLNILGIMDECRNQMGLVFPFED